MVTTKQVDENLANDFIEYLRAGQGLLVDTKENVLEVVGILKSYGIVLDEYSNNLIYIAENQFFSFFPFLQIL
ncbi:Low-affinity CO2 hydration protein CphX [Richelia intracellularis HM01]|nr:Low-affinity CO2 hydration protein CphX [Richelia intracellularis HM01]